MKTQIICTLAAVGLMVGCSRNADMNSGAAGPSSETTAGAQAGPTVGTTWNDLPPVVQQAVKAQAPNAVVDDIDKEDRSGRTIYEITFKDPGANPKIHIAADGTVVKSDLGKADSAAVNPTAPAVADAGAPGNGPIIGTTMKDLPAAVRQTIMEKAPNAEVKDIDKETRSGGVVYEITFKDEGKNPKMHIAADGTVVQELQK